MLTLSTPATAGIVPFLEAEWNKVLTSSLEKQRRGHHRKYWTAGFTAEEIQHTVVAVGLSEDLSGVDCCPLRTIIPQLTPRMAFLRALPEDLEVIPLLCENDHVGRYTFTMMPFIRTMSIAFRLLYIMSTVYGNFRRNSSQGDPKHVKYYDPISAAHLSSQRPLKYWDDYFNKSARRRSNVAVVLPVVVPGLPLRRDRRRLLAYDVDQVTSSTRASPRLVKRDLPNAVLCLVVACLALMVILLCLSIAALWLRSRYRIKDKAIYTTLSVSDPDLSTPAIPLPLRRWHIPGERSVRSIAERVSHWSREIKRNSVSEPALSSAKVADYSPDNGLNSPLRSPSDGDKASAKLTESSEVKMTPFSAVMTASEDGRKSLRVKSTEAPLPLRSYSIERTNTAGRQPASGRLSDHRDSIVRTHRSGKRKRSQGRITVDKGSRCR
ncbi:hypothetical protein HPB51_026690 [Rhipicephalus microplus]|uniref:Uncharacterized protein n=1 Tax=Rhipicephalus microplus TaxID=6941 RepID=A0A9J6D2E8_RHIMP|nr:hypothetical protein HPB51_026690 [Rhipicephalus microplus]